MIEGEVSNGAPTIRDKYGWREARHSSRYRSIRYANLRKKVRTEAIFILTFLQIEPICSHFWGIFKQNLRFVLTFDGNIL